MFVQIVRYGTGLTREEVAERFESRADGYREVAGLLQKYYVRYDATDEYGGIYVWDSQESLDAWRAGGLAGTLAETYQVVGEPTRELAEVMLVLYQDRLPD